MKYAGVAELADAPDLGSGGRPCRFKSCHPYEMIVVFGYPEATIFYHSMITVAIRLVCLSIVHSASLRPAASPPG